MTTLQDFGIAVNEREGMYRKWIEEEVHTVTGVTIEEDNYGEFTVFNTVKGKVYAGGQVVLEQGKRLEEGFSKKPNQDIKLVLSSRISQSGRTYKFLKDVD